MQISSARNIVWLLLVLLVVVAGSFYFLIRQGYLNLSKETVIPGSQIVEKEKVVIGVSELPSVYPECVYELSNMAFNTALFDQLVTFDRENKIQSDLALRWDNPDNLTWRFYLRQDAKFTNGTPITANDVKFTYDYLLENRSKLPFDIASLLPYVQSVTATDNYTVEFKTVSPDPVLLNRLASGFLILPQGEVKTNGLKNHVGSGPYIISSMNEEEIVLTRDENYWASIKPKVKTVVYKKVGEDKKFEALLNGEVDFITYAYSKDKESEIKSIQQSSVFETSQTAGSTLVYLEWDTSREKSPYIDVTPNPLRSEKVREAIYKGVNIDKILEANKGAVPLSQLAYPAIFGYNPEIKRPSYDLTTARTLLAEAGYPNGFSITIDYLETPGAKEAFQPLVDELANLNIKAKLNGLDEQSFFPKIMQKDTSAFIIASSFPTQDGNEILEGILHTPTEKFGMYNLTYSNPEIDKKIEEVVETLDYAVRKQKIQEVMKIAMEDVAKLPLFQALTYFSYKKDIYFLPRLDATFHPQDLAGKQ